MTGTDRLCSEREFHDRQAADRSLSFQLQLAQLTFADDEFLDHETWVRPAFAKLGEVCGKYVLDYGCGHGMAAVVLVRAGATVTAIDLSPGYVAETRHRAIANGVRVESIIANCEELPFADESFDAVWGNAILHHLDLARAARELRRVMRSGAVAVFCEPWGGNPVLGFTRRWLPYPGKHRTPDERPLTRRDLAPLRAVFPSVLVEGFQLFGMLRRIWNQTGVVRRLECLDRHLLRQIPALHNWCRYAVITLRKPVT